MKRLPLLGFLFLMIFVDTPRTDADDLLLTLDLRNTYRDDALSGGTWQLGVRKIETGGGAQGDFGVSNFRALINNINMSSVMFLPGTGQMTSGGPFTNTLANGTIEIIYQQDLNGMVVNGVGVPPAPFRRDTQIASGSWPAGPRPTFGIDPGGFASTGSFLGTASAPYPPSVPADNTLTDVVTLGDLNDTNTITLSDIAPFVHQLFGVNNPDSYNPTADMNQSGSVSNLDIAPFATIFLGPTAPVTVVPEPGVGISILVGVILIAALRSRQIANSIFGGCALPRSMRNGLGAILVVILSGNLNAGTVFFAGDVGFIPFATTGTIELRFNLDPGDSFINGGVELEVVLRQPGVAKFTSAEVINNSGRWSIATEEVSDNSVKLLAASILSPALPQGGNDVLFATINYQRIGCCGTPLRFEWGIDALVNGNNYPGNVDVTPNYTFQNYFIGEPGPGDFDGDFDGDGDTDGKDFLAWQRGNSPTPFSSGDLSDWQSGYGSPLTAATAVPEPSCLALLLGLLFMRRHHIFARRAHDCCQGL